MIRRRTAPVTAVLTLLTGLAGLVLAWAAPAGAHGGDGIVTVEAAHPTATGVHYVIKVVWEDDLDPVTDATVTITATSPGGVTQDPVTMELLSEADGTYGGLVEMDEPGTWQLEFTSAEPPGSASDSYDHAPAEGSTGTTAGAEGAEEPEVSTSGDAELEVSVGESASDDDDDGPSLALVVIAFAVLAALVAGVFWLVVRRSGLGSGPAGGSGAGGGDQGPADGDDGGDGGGSDAGGSSAGDHSAAHDSGEGDPAGAGKEG